MFMRHQTRLALCGLIVGALGCAMAGGAFAAADWPKTNDTLWPLGVFEKKNLNIRRPKAPFDLTGTWTLDRDPASGGFNFLPLPKLKPPAQALYDEGVKANAQGKAFMDDTGLCWPAGMPKWWTRVWPIQIMQYPTVIVGIQGLFNSTRSIYLDGRGHANPDLIEQTYNGDSVGRWEGDTLVVDTTDMQPKRHWVMQGIPTSDKFHIVERIRMAKNRQSFTVELIMTDPVNWEGEWRNTKRFKPVRGEDVVESHCLPDLNDNIVATHADHNQR